MIQENIYETPAGGRYNLGERFSRLDMRVRVHFPVDFPVEEFRLMIVEGDVFAQREGDYPLWFEFTHFVDGRTRSCFIKQEWIVERLTGPVAAPMRKPFKRPR